MDFRRFGAAGVEVPRIAQGTWEFPEAGGRLREAKAALRRGIELGMIHIDTAEMYGAGRVEQIVGDATRGIDRSSIFLTSKVLPSNGSFQDTIAACERSLRQLRTDYLDLYLLHWPGSIPIAETMSALERLVEDGKVRFIGVSNFDVDELDEAVGALEKLHQLQPKDREIGMMLADAYIQSQEYEKADAVYANLLSGDANDAEVESARGQVLIREQKYQEALEMFQRAVKVRQDDSDAWAGIAFAASKTGQFQLTVDALTMRSKLVSDSPVTYFLWATAYDNLHQYKQSVEYYQLFLKSALGKFPDEEWQAKQRLAVLEKNK